MVLGRIRSQPAPRAKPLDHGHPLKAHEIVALWQALGVIWRNVLGTGSKRTRHTHKEHDTLAPLVGMVTFTELPLSINRSTA